MSHDPEQLAASWLGGAMRRTARLRYETHLLTCEPCWREVTLARRGRALAEDARSLAPPGLREDIRTAIAARSAEDRTSTTPPVARRRTVISVAVLILGMLGSLSVLRPWQSSSGALSRSGAGIAVLADVEASYRDGKLPGTAVPPRPAPNLSPLGLTLAGAAAGQFDNVAISEFAYRGVTGNKVTLYRSAQSFAEAAEAHELNGPEGAWTLATGGVDILCGRGRHSLLILGTDQTLVRQVGSLLNVI